MPAPIPVELWPYDPAWPQMAEREMERLKRVLGGNLVAIHHIGSTAVAGLAAKPILDLMPVVRNLGDLDGNSSTLEGLGYEWWGEFGMPGRRYCTLSDSAGRRLVQLHCFEEGASDVERHLAFREYLKTRPEVAKEYEGEKQRCAALHPDDSHAYNDCKNGWIRKMEIEALEWWGSRTS